MEFGWNREESALFERMQRLGADIAGLASDERLAALAREGVLGLCIAREHGGGGHSLVATARAFEGLGTHLDDAGVLLAAGAHLFGVAMTLARVGDADQRARLLPALASGACLATVAATEDEAGSDVGAARGRLEPRGDGYRASGAKRFVTQAAHAGLFLWVGRRPADRGLTVALVERGPGVEVTQRYDTLGLGGAGLGAVLFTEAAVPAENVLGRPGAGMAVFQIAMAHERALVLAFRLGAMQRQLDEAVAFTRRRKVGGRRIADHQAVSHRIAAMKARLEAARLLTYRAAWALDHQPRAHAEAALAKWWLAEAAVDSALDAMRLRGGLGYLADEGFGATLADTLGGTIHSGTRDVLATIIAGWLGL